MSIFLERIYNPPIHKGYRVLADRLWPRGLAKEKAVYDEWCKDVTPSPELRKWFAHDPTRWDEFCQAYMAQLRANPTPAQELLKRAHAKPIILLTATKNMAQTHIIVLKEFLDKLT